ncbi:MAG: flagellar basal body-associated FliL family protein [Alphaproteobacteria bacterium]|nr:flagellar basal body-associated FliL family protein [Alphaproteobacteria bacterium]
MRMVLIAVVLLLVLGGGGAAAYFYFSKTAEASPAAEAGKAEEKHDEAKKEGGGHGEGGGALEYVNLDPLILPIVDETGVTQTVSLVIAIEIPDASKKDQVKSMIPRLNDAFIQDMYGVLNRHAGLKGGVIQVTMIKERLKKIAAKVLGDDVAADVLLQVVQQRPV